MKQVLISEELMRLWEQIAEVLLKDPHNDKMRMAFRKALDAFVAQAQQPAPPADVPMLTDEEVLAGCRVMLPYAFAHGLKPLEKDGPVTAARMRDTEMQVRKVLDAARAAEQVVRQKAGLK